MRLLRAIVNWVCILIFPFNAILFLVMTIKELVKYEKFLAATDFSHRVSVVIDDSPDWMTGKDWLWNE